MGQFKNVGDCFLTLAEECNELSQAILKKYRFGGEWDSEVEGKVKTRKELVMDEMYDVLYQMSRCYAALGYRMNVDVESLDDDDPIDDTVSEWEEYINRTEEKQRAEQEEIERAATLVEVVEQEMNDMEEWEEWEEVRMREMQHLNNLEYELEVMEQELRDSKPPRMSYEDMEDVNDAYQARLEYNYWVSETRDRINKQMDMIADYRKKLRDDGLL